ncbi:metal-sensing transcriptional repressor, partial [Acidithiobacillus caldus]
MSAHDRRAILQRMARLEGQIRGIRQMLEED